MTERRNHEEIRATLVEAAIDLAAGGGTAAVTFRGVAARAGVSAGKVQHYFPTAQALQASAQQALTDAARAAVENAVSAGTPRAQIEGIAEALLPADDASLRDARARVAFFHAVVNTDPGEFARGPRRVIALVRSILEAADLRAGIDPAHEAKILWGLIDPTAVLGGYRGAEENKAALQYHLDRIFLPKASCA
ncbi:TetR/AcrR family transcriptional regulator [Corynebacterium vitaeruminis]|uniref:TetR/AcrR family transcriptional regulator n=1 Tax=Corynebacterium vitaeruminis TaxID=38305 RepID=UPI00068FA3D1|nr:TetR/AcrR family transcriptional regulator [Corynebacterium vitaeruminis]